MTTKRAVIVGCGAISKTHAAAIEKAGGELVACADIIPERANRYGVTAYHSYEDMLEKEKPDVVHICTPHYLHVPMAVTALRKGINTLLEKPPAMNSEQLYRLKRDMSETDTALAVCFQNRFNATTAEAMTIIKNGAYGKLIGARAVVTWNRHGDYYTKSGWRGKKITEGGGVLINQSIHTLDLLNCLLGRPVSVSAVSANLTHGQEIDVEDTVCAQIDYGGRGAVFYATTSNCTDTEAEVMLYFETASVSFNRKVLRVTQKDGIEKVFTASQSLPVGKSCWGSSHEELIGRFYQSLDGECENPCPLSSCEDTVRLMTAIYDAGLSGVTRKELV